MLRTVLVFLAGYTPCPSITNYSASPVTCWLAHGSSMCLQICVASCMVVKLTDYITQQQQTAAASCWCMVLLKVGVALTGAEC